MNTKMATEAMFSHIVSKKSIQNDRRVTLAFRSLLLLLYTSTLLHVEKLAPHSCEVPGWVPIPVIKQNHM